MFQIIKQIDEFKSMDNTSHITKRSKRLQVANMLLVNEKASLIGYYVIDKNHDNGLEVHAVYNNGIVKIYNYDTSKFITCLICREAQIKRYNIKLTSTMKKKIKTHIKNHYNEIAF